MVLNQEVTRSSSSLSRLAGGLALLLLAAGCQTTHSTVSAGEAPKAATRAKPADAAAAQENAIEAAIARADSEPVAATAPAKPAPVMNPSAPLSYTVKRGDTLWDIAAKYLRDPWLWPEIWHVNPAIKNPHLIYPGDMLTLAYGANGEPQIHLTPGNALRVEPLVRSTALDGPIATIPYDAIASFLGKPGILSKEDLRHAPHVAALGDRHVVGGAGNVIFVKGLQQSGPGRYTVVRQGDLLKDPDTGRVLGYMGIYAGAARIDNTAAVSKGLLTESAREVQAGDLVFAVDVQSASTDIVPRAPPAGVAGRIIAVVDGVSLIGQYQVVAINRGSAQGMETGHVLAIEQPGEVVPDASCKRSGMSWCLGKKIRLPTERVGTLLVFKVYDRMSYGLIVSAQIPVQIGDQVRTP